MQPAMTKTSEFKQRLLAELQRDKKKAVIMSVLLVVAVVVIGRLLLKSGPRGAQAQPPEPVPAAGGLQLEPDAATVTRRRDVTREEYLLRMERSIKRDLFKPNLELFLPDGSVAAAPGGAQGWIDQFCDLANAAPADRKVEQQARLLSIQKRAAALNLQSVMLGSSPIVLINGKPLKVGEYTDGFRVMAITAEGCVVSMDGVNERLVMKQADPTRSP
jgi:hypothetical protein